MKNRINLQMFANFEEVLEANPTVFADGAFKEHYSALTGKLGELGIDVLLNTKAKAEFIPASRLSEVAAQRDGLKATVEAQNAQLELLKKEQGNSEATNAKIQTLIDENAALLTSLEEEKVNTAIMLEAKDANDPKDLLVFINREEVLKTGGVVKEVERLRKEKPYLFGKGALDNKGGADMSGGSEGKLGVGMNALIRRTAGR